MNKKEFEAKLVENFPDLYADMHGDASKTCLAFGVEIAPGWYDLVYSLSAKVDAIIQSFPKEIAKNYRVSQVKEKFGGLRFYMTTSTPEVAELIHEAESVSYKLCQTCGQPGKLVTGGWLYVSCKDHAKQEHKNQFEDK